MTPLRTGILGCGGYAQRHAQILQSLPEEAVLVACCDRHEDRAAALAAQYAPDAQLFTDHHRLLTEANLDLLIIALPPYGHTDEVEAAAARGVHLLIEKPIALTTEKAWQMVAAVEAAGIKTQVGFMFRFGAAIEQFKALEAQGQVGTIGLMTARYFCNALHADWWRVREKSGGQLFEQAIHLFDLMRYLMGDAVRVYSRQENLFHQQMPDYTIEDVSTTVVSFRHGGLGVVAATNGAIPGKWLHDYRVVAQQMTVDFASANHATFYPTHAPDQAPIQVESDFDFRQALTLDLIRAIRTDGDTRIPMREGAKTLEVVAAAVRSNELRAEVAL